MQRDDQPASSGIASLPAIVDMAAGYGMNAQAFIYTFRTVAMPQPHSDAEFVSCCLVAHAHGLNPLTKELYFMKSKSGGIQAIVSVDGWMKKCNEHPQFDGMEFSDEHDAQGQLISTTCTIYRKDRTHPIKVTEYLDECLKVGGPVWQKSPRRMLRHRALTQCARYAFGFAGIMDRDEFDQWQRTEAKDITPKAAPAVATDFIPDFSAEPEAAPSDDESGLADAGDDDRLSPDQEEAALSNLRDELAAATPGTRMEIIDMYESLIERMSKAGKDRADAIIEGRAK